MTSQPIRIIEGRLAIKDLKYAPHEIIRAYEIWARLVEEHGSHILKKFNGYNDEQLAGNWQGYRSCRLNRQWRIIYSSSKLGIVEVVTVERITAHDYRRK